MKVFFRFFVIQSSFVLYVYIDFCLSFLFVVDIRLYFFCYNLSSCFFDSLLLNMGDLPSNVNIDNLSSFNSNDEQSNFNFNRSNNVTLPSIDGSSISYETMRIYFFAIIIITVLICLTICITVCTCICRKRYVFHFLIH